MWGAVGAGLGTIIHNQVGGVITLLAWGLVVDNLLFGLALLRGAVHANEPVGRSALPDWEGWFLRPALVAWDNCSPA